MASDSDGSFARYAATYVAAELSDWIYRTTMPSEEEMYFQRSFQMKGKPVSVHFEVIRFFILDPPENLCQKAVVSVQMMSPGLGELKILAVVFKGTEILNDWLANLSTIFMPVRSLPHFREHGLAVQPCWYAMMEYNLRELEDMVDDFARNSGNSNCQLLVTGHSLGGATAQLFASHLQLRAKNQNQNQNEQVKKLWCITFAASTPFAPWNTSQPREQDYRNMFQRYINFVRPVDIVPRCPPLLAKLLRVFIEGKAQQACDYRPRPYFEIPVTVADSYRFMAANVVLQDQPGFELVWVEDDPQLVMPEQRFREIGKYEAPGTDMLTDVLHLDQGKVEASELLAQHSMVGYFVHIIEGLHIKGMLPESIRYSPSPKDLVEDVVKVTEIVKSGLDPSGGTALVPPHQWSHDDEF